jgi:pectate lyase
MAPDAVGYEYTLLGSGAVAGTVPGEAGAILTF